MRLSFPQQSVILEHFQNAPTQGSKYGWSRRQYAPMHIHSESFRSLKKEISRDLPEYVHFNLTPNGGRLVTLNWPLLSSLYSFVISVTGIYSLCHRVLNLLCWPLVFLFSKSHTNEPNVGNVFDNMRLHAVTSGDERISYVVRLIKRNGCVTMTRNSIIKCSERSSACKRLNDIILPKVPEDKVVDAGEFEWKSLTLS